MKGKKISLLILALAMAFAFSLPAAYAGDHGKSGKSWEKGKEGQWDLESKFEHKAKFMLKKDDELGITDEQEDRIKALKADVKKELIKKDAEIDVIAVDLKGAMWKDDMNVEEVNKLIDKKYGLKAEKAKYLVSSSASLKNILTADQKTKMKELYKSRCKCGKCAKCKASKM